ncbi:family 88 glycosyl hydrolase [Mycena belliarum]|uniref:Family 88 glycosyl hydrolase n=1 Tax=Mycena belliarum TaxID=1033014 RepID=A0AAD6TX00_9AGAR|nr:family 88 glycosyl hydrolase [Mycena belliae]
MPTLTSLLITLSAAALAASTSPTPFDPGFNISAVAVIAEALPRHSWEYGTAAEALLELYNPRLSVFGLAPFPVPTLSKEKVPSLVYAAPKVVLGRTGLDNGGGTVGDPASLGVAAVMLGKTNATFAAGAQREIQYLIDEAPRWPNGAISHRASVAELWADFMYMAPPFIAYFAADTNNATLLQIAYEQCGLQREVLLLGSNATTPSPVGSGTTSGRWHHIVGPQSADPGLWSTGNGWAAMGMARVLATVLKAPVGLAAAWQASAVADLTAWIKEIIDGARASPLDGGLLRNYLDDTTSAHGFGEIAGSAMLAATAYRMAVLAPFAFPAATYVAWADEMRAVLGTSDAQGNPHITTNGTATPAVNPLGWQDTAPWTAGSPEGNNFVVLMYVAWRDCIYAGVCDA